MNRQNWIYICSISGVALLLAIPALSDGAIQAHHWKAFFILIALSMAAQVVSSAMPKKRLHIPRMIFFFTGVLLLQPLLILSLILLITIVDWEHDRRERNPSVRDGYLLPLSISVHVSAAFSTHWMLELLQTVPLWILSVYSVAVVVLAALSYALVHHAIGHGLILVQGAEWDESGIFDIDTLFVKVALLFIGYGLAILWVVNPWLLLLGLIPGLYYYQVHVIPSLKVEAYTDAKTGLSNMRHFDDLFQTELSRASRTNTPLCVLMVDVDDLGLINNTYGHLTGDGALLTVSETIRLQISQNDIAARLGGEEFAIILPESELHVAATFAEVLRQEIESARFSVINEDEKLQTTVSIGVAAFPEHGITTLELIHSADIAMYQAKNQGKNLVILADEVENYLNSATGHQESTEILNYRAAFNLPNGESSPNGTPTIEQTSISGAAPANSVDQEHVSPNQSPSEQSAYSSERPFSGLPKDTSLYAENNPFQTRTYESNGLHRAFAMAPEDVKAVGDQSSPTTSISAENRKEQLGLIGADEPSHRYQSTNDSQNLTDDHRLGLGIDSAVTKYQSELLNGPPTTEIIRGMFKGQSAARVENVVEQISSLLVFPAVGAAAIAVGFGLFYTVQPINLLSLVVFGIVAIIVQLLQHSMYESSTVSVSAAIILAGTLVEGMPGLLATCSVIVLVHAIQNQTSVDKTVFNWSVHILAGLAPLSVYLLGAPQLSIPLTILVVLTLVSAIIYYFIESAMVSVAIGMAKGQSIIAVWDNYFRWLIVHYVVAGFIAISMAIAFLALGPWGIVAFAMPVLLIYFAQKQYVARTELSTRKLNHMNRELSKANNGITTANRSFQRLTDELFMILSKIIDARDPDVHGHAAQVANYAEAIAHELGIKQDEIEKVRHGALLHDIGKIGISELILHKPGPLTDNEYETIKNHPVLGADFLETCHSLRSLAPYVRHHHEWWNGKGYPAQLRQDEIPMGARIIGVCDAVEAMTSDRPYRKGLSIAQVIAELEKGKGIQFDPLVVDAFIKVLRREGQGYLQNTARSDTFDPELLGTKTKTPQAV